MSYAILSSFVIAYYYTTKGEDWELLVKVRQIVISTLIYVQIVFLHYVTNCSISFFCEQGSTQ